MKVVPILKDHKRSRREKKTFLMSFCKIMQSTSYEMSGWMKLKVESRLPGEIAITSDMQMTPSLWQKVKRS